MVRELVGTGSDSERRSRRLETDRREQIQAGLGTSAIQGGALNGDSENESAQPKTTLEWAERYLEMGFSVIPLPPRSKKARLKWKPYQRKKPSLEQVRAWWGRHPTWGIAIVIGKVSGVIVLDPESAEAVAEIERRGVPDTWIVETARGKHYYFRYPEFAVKNKPAKSDGWPFQDAELRGDNLYVAAPPNIHPTGKQYAWIRSPLDCPLANAPEWLLDLVKPVSRHQKKEKELPLRQISDSVEYLDIGTGEVITPVESGDWTTLVDEYVLRAKVGNRNVTGFELALRCRDGLLTKSQASVLVLNYQSRVPQLPGKRYTKSASSASLDQAYKVEPRKVGRTHSAEFFGKVMDAIARATDLSKSDKLVLTFLANRDRDDGKDMFPSFRKLATDTSLSIGSVSRSIHKLEKQDWIKIEKIPVATGEHGRFRFRYQILLPGVDEGLEPTLREDSVSLSQTHAGSVSMANTNEEKNVSQDSGKRDKMEKTMKESRKTNRGDGNRASSTRQHSSISSEDSGKPLTLQQVAHRFGKCRQTIMIWVNKGRLDCVRATPTSVYFTEAQIENFIDRHTQHYSPAEVPKI